MIRSESRSPPSSVRDNQTPPTTSTTSPAVASMVFVTRGRPARLPRRVAPFLLFLAESGRRASASDRTPLGSMSDRISANSRADCTRSAGNFLRQRCTVSSNSFGTPGLDKPRGAG